MKDKIARSWNCRALLRQRAQFVWLEVGYVHSTCSEPEYPCVSPCTPTPLPEEGNQKGKHENRKMQICKNR